MRIILTSFVLLVSLAFSFSQEKEKDVINLFLWDSPHHKDSLKEKEIRLKDVKFAAVFESSRARNNTSNPEYSIPDSTHLVIVMLTKEGLPVYVFLNDDQYNRIYQKFPDESQKCLKGLSFEAYVVDKKSIVSEDQKNLLGHFFGKVKYVIIFSKSYVVDGEIVNGKIIQIHKPRFSN